MNVQYNVLDPTGNITILVETPVPEALQVAVADSLMQIEPSAEQVGFISQGGRQALTEEGIDLALRMAGGEFCGNASMCAAALAAIHSGHGGRFRLRVSGAPAPVRVDIIKRAKDVYAGVVDMPRPVRIVNGREGALPSVPYPVVFFDGIAHIVIEDMLSRKEASMRAPIWCRCLSADAVGLMFFDRQAGTLTPLVYVPAAGTLCWENSCASGTTAIGAFLAQETGEPVSLSLRQPGGNLAIDAAPGGSLRLSGTVRLIKSTSARMDLT